MKQRGLGRGLSELFGDSVATTQASEDIVQHIRLQDLEANKYQPRQLFDNRALDELADSIKRNGIIQPIVVRKDGKKYSIIAGERRFRAAKIVGLGTIPAIVRDTTDSQSMEFAVIENIQREDLGAIEEAESYHKLMEEFSYNQEDIANIIGKSRSHVANILRLNSLPEGVKDMLSSRKLTISHAKLLVGHKNAEEIAAKIVYDGLNSRQAERLVKNWGQDPKARSSTGNTVRRDEDEDLSRLADTLSEKFGMKINIESDGGRGKMIFHYSSLEQLDSILVKLN